MGLVSKRSNTVVNKRDIRCYTKADSHRCWKDKRVNFQEVHSYYQTLKIDTYLAEIIEEGEALSVGINKKMFNFYYNIIKLLTENRIAIEIFIYICINKFFKNEKNSTHFFNDYNPNHF